MAAQWSSEQYIGKYGDLQASAMAVDCLGRWTVLAGRKMLSLLDLGDHELRLHRNPRQSKWDISCVQWNPHPSHAHLFVTASNQKLDVFSWKDMGISHQSSIRGHSRTVSDVGWSPFDANLIASCSVDTLINLWDVTDPKKAVASFQTVAGASQIKWNKMTNNLFATTHEGDVRIWDKRQGNAPLHYIAAHLSKIHGLDWSPTSETSLATSSQDGTVKFWDMANPRQCKGTLTADLPVWRARYTPFGQGMVTVVVPQLRRGDNVLYLWNITNSSPVHQFVGHNDVILEFQWRKQQENSKDFQLVTWSKDQSLRIWRIEPLLQKKCGHDVGDISDSSENEMTPVPMFTTQNSEDLEKARADLERQMSLSPENYQIQQPRTLQQEFDLINTDIPNIRVEELDPEQRLCRVIAITKSGTGAINLVMRFPENYPSGSMPAFEFLEPNINNSVRQKLHKVLSDTALKHLKRNNNCVEPCLRQLSNALEFPLQLNIQPEERRTPEMEMPYPISAPYPFPAVPTKMAPPQYPGHGYSYADMNIPFPRTSGAKFCGAGYLVVFGRAQEAQKGPSGTDCTPKSLSELVEYNSKVKMRTIPQIVKQQIMPTYQFAQSPPKTALENVSMLQRFYRPQQSGYMKTQYRSKKSRPKDLGDSRTKEQDKKLHLSPVKIFDGFCVLPISRHLGEKYIINKDDIPGMCRHNAAVADAIGRKDLVRVWNVVSQIGHPHLRPSKDPDDGAPWACNPFGRPMLKSMMDHYSKLYDVQTLAMLCCVFWDRQDVVPPNPSKTHSSSMEHVPQNYNAYHTVTSGSNLLKSFQSVLKLRRSNSWSCLEDSFEDYRFEDEGVDQREKEVEREQRQHENNCRMLDPSGHYRYDRFLRTYSDILFHWGLQNQSAQVLKFAHNGRESHRGIEFGVKCHYCRQAVRGAYCGCCKNLAFNCIICHTGVKGLGNFCLACGHGGHTSHLLEWFKTETECPSGCGCICALAEFSLIGDTI